MICVAFFLQILPNRPHLLLYYSGYYLSFLVTFLLLFTPFSKVIHYLLHLVKRYSSHRGTVGSASACQARGWVGTRAEALHF